MRPHTTAARWAFVALVLVLLALPPFGLAPYGVGCAGAVLLFAGAYWIASREQTAAGGVVHPPPPEPPEARAAREATERAAHAAEGAAIERAEAVLQAALTREGVPHTYRPPAGGHMDLRYGTYTLARPLPLSAADVDALAAPPLLLDVAPAPGGLRHLVRLDAVDRHGAGFRVRTA